MTPVSATELRGVAPSGVVNHTPYGFAELYLPSESGRMLVVPFLQASFDIVSSRKLVLAEEQPAPSLTGELWGADAATSSYRVEPATAFTKTATDVFLLGAARAPQRATEVLVGLRISGPCGVSKAVRVTGDRTWVRSLGTPRPTPALAVDGTPLIFERAFGGYDVRASDPNEHAYEPRNPVGRGFRRPGSAFEDGVALPNLEHPGDVVTTWGQTVQPACFGVVSPNWQPRLALAGTFDAAWRATRMPLLPKNFDRRFFNAAPEGLVAKGHLRGDEQVVVTNASTLGTLELDLPGLTPPPCEVQFSFGGSARPVLVLDTVIVDAERRKLSLIYRGFAPLRHGAADVQSIHVGAPPGLGRARRTEPTPTSTP